MDAKSDEINAEGGGIMKLSTKLRTISLIMLCVANIFIACALANPALGRTFHIGSIEIGVEVWRAFYAIYAIIMCLLFVASFFVGKPIGGVKIAIVKLLIFTPVALLAFFLGAISVLSFAWWKLFTFMAVCVGFGYGVHYLFRWIDKKCGGKTE